MQYTIRNVPGTLDEALRRAAREQGKSLNEVAIEALARGAGVTAERGRQRDLNDIAGTWRPSPDRMQPGTPHLVVPRNRQMRWAKAAEPCCWW